ncbi:NADH-quinone oxidoreductase subunit NuoE [Enterobacteriaceae endosymbiont of Donacia thalassina]|uniref:NADH-quinone oxidoreductase subunit NuoE n=1 Tax=Enterobacteriaceae endosymbiont of Donacia thalassina TaxID=2675786 RepID=UPI001449739A|nr:NADH-quinone oxidoreductase subunit NuoE [Enterobacteriaceae endosymbiont of Donacia thalassina]QJC37467.1 NADH-quinone oxidoreductase subunit NuoE [Enterobacteriaceae endosymbiont of Donacia thalassina]
MKKITNKINIFLNEKELKIINKIKNNYECNNAAIIEILIFFQKKYGWISDNIIILTSNILDINPSEIDSIATFYSQIFRSPVGKYVIKYCDSVVCYITKYEKILKYIQKRLNIKSGQTTCDQLFTLIPICCLGHCENSPVIMINEKVYTSLSINYINQILDHYINENHKTQSKNTPSNMAY